MVRLRNPMANLTDAGPGPPRPLVDDDAALLARLDGSLRAYLREALSDVRGRVLVIGAGWPELAFELAARDIFVTLLDPRADRLAALQTQTIERGLTRRLTLDARSYGDVSFSATSFEAIVLYEPFAYLASPQALVKKCRREMKAGGLLLVRAVLASGAPFPDPTPPKGLVAKGIEIPEAGRFHGPAATVRDRVVDGLYKVLGTARLLRDTARVRWQAGQLGGPSTRGFPWDELQEALAGELVVTRVDACQLVSFELAELASALRPPLGVLPDRLLELGLQLDERLFGRPAARALASTVLVHATRERELGRVFTLPRR